MRNTISPSTTTNTHTRNYYIGLSLLILLVFGNTVQNGYNMDDDLVTQHHRFTSKGFEGLKDIVSNSYYSNNSDIVFGYRPVTHITFAMEHQFFGESPFVSHLINIILYLISTLVLFHLLFKWFGAANFWIPVIAAFLFAVHPIHTEVVASIKNRDEILALLFALISAHALHSYSIHKRWYQLLLAIVLFIIALLSKKSVYPLVVIVPLILYLLSLASSRRIIVSSLLMILPSAWITADFVWQNAIFIFSVTSILLIALFFLAYIYKHPGYIKKILYLLNKSGIHLVVIILLFALGFYLNDWVCFAVATLLFVVTTMSNPNKYGFLLVVLNSAIAYYYNYRDLTYVVLLHASYLAYVQFKNGFKDLKTTASVLIALSVFVMLVRNYISLLILIQIVLFYYLLNKKPIYGLLVALLSIVFSVYFFNVPIYQWLLLLISLVEIAKKHIDRIKNELLSQILITLFLIIPLCIVISKSNQPSKIVHDTVSAFIPSNNQIPAIINASKKTDGLKEGRNLHYIENTLVAPHTPVEKCFTGLVTMGEYLRLMVFPYELSFYYGFAILETAHAGNFKVWLALIFHVLLAMIAFRYRHKSIAILVGFVWYVTSIFLFSNCIELVAGMVGERLAYTASAGFCLFFSAVVVSIKPDLNLQKPQWVEYCLLLVLLLFSTRSIMRNSQWKDPVTLMQNDIKHLDNSAQAHHLLAINLLYAAGNEKNPQSSAQMIEQAKVSLEKSISLYPYFFNTQYELARLYISQSDWSGARQKLIDAFLLDTTNLFVLESLAKVCFELNLPFETELYANQFISYMPYNENIHEILAYTMFINEQYDKALIYVQRGLKYFPSGKNLQPLMKDIEQKIAEKNQL